MLAVAAIIGSVILSIILPGIKHKERVTPTTTTEPANNNAAVEREPIRPARMAPELSLDREIRESEFNARLRVSQAIASLDRSIAQLTAASVHSELYWVERTTMPTRQEFEIGSSRLQMRERKIRVSSNRESETQPHNINGIRPIDGAQQTIEAITKEYGLTILEDPITTYERTRSRIASYLTSLERGMMHSGDETVALSRSTAPLMPNDFRRIWIRFQEDPETTIARLREDIRTLDENFRQYRSR
ncbi:hypothetical protein HY990_04335 [Candidatus Micrarchaeota archaeon]|nr:hypothetical protein [Candidatus Micrarchaeota archaeon]